MSNAWRNFNLDLTLPNICEQTSKIVGTGTNAGNWETRLFKKRLHRDFRR